MRPKFLDQPYRWMTTRRQDQSDADYASPISHQPSQRSWMYSDIVIALVLVAVLLCVAFGVMR
jgi:hypothetical protein